MDYRADLFKRYEGLFVSDGNEDEDVEISGRMTIDSSNAIAQSKKNRKWSWFSVIYSLCKGDITKTDEVVSKTFVECLIWLSYEKEMDIKK